MNVNPPQSPLYRLVDLEEKAIASLLLEHDIVTPAALGNGTSADEGSRRGFVQLLVYNPHDLAFYCKFLRSPFLSAVEAGMPGADSAPVDRVGSAVADILVRYDEMLTRMARHAHRLTQADKLLPLNFLGERDKKQQTLEWLEKLCDRGSLREWFDLSLYQLFPLNFDDVFAERTFHAMRPVEPQTFTISQITEAIVSRRAEAARDGAHPAFHEYLELAHILDFLLFGSWVDRSVDYGELMPLFGESWDAGAEYLATRKGSFQRVKLPIWYPHSVLGVLIVGWEGKFRKSDRQLVEMLAGHAGGVGSDLRMLRAEIASRRLQHDRDAVVDSVTDLLGCRSGTLIERDRSRSFAVTPASEELFDVRHVSTGRRRSDASPEGEGSLAIGLPRDETLEIRYDPLIQCDNAEFVEAHREKLIWDISVALGHSVRADDSFELDRFRLGMHALRESRGTMQSVPMGTAAALVVADLLCRHLAVNDLTEIPPETEIRLLAKQSHQKREGIAYALVNRMPDPPVGFWWICHDEEEGLDGLGSSEATAEQRDEYEDRFLLTTDIKQAAYFLREAAERREFVEFFSRHGLWVGTLNSKNQRLSGDSGRAKAGGNICWIAIRNAADAGKKKVASVELGASELLEAELPESADAAGISGVS